MTIWLWINTYNYHFYEEKHPYPAAVFIWNAVEGPPGF
jgi:hypothetical protein